MNRRPVEMGQSDRTEGVGLSCPTCEGPTGQAPTQMSSPTMSLFRCPVSRHLRICKYEKKSIYGNIFLLYIYIYILSFAETEPAILIKEVGQM